MKISNALIGLIGLSMLPLASCNKNGMCVKGQGGDVIQTISVNSFTQIDLAEASNVYIHQGAEQKVVVTAPSNIIDLLDRSVSGERWDIDFGKDCARDYSMSIDITIPNLEQIVLSGSGNITIDDFTGANTLGLTISGSGNIDVNKFNGISGVKALISGSGNIVTRDTTTGINDVEIVISGSGYFNGYGFRTANSDVLISGSGNVQTFVDQALSAKISGSGDVFYKGYPAVNVNISGSGDVVNAN